MPFSDRWHIARNMPSNFSGSCPAIIETKRSFPPSQAFLDLSTSPHQASAQSLSQALKRDNFPHLLREFKRLRIDSSDAHVLFEDFRKQQKCQVCHSVEVKRSETLTKILCYMANEHHIGKCNISHTLQHETVHSLQSDEWGFRALPCDTMHELLQRSWT